ncbi:Ornithine decarboxylase [Orchesella cincta]|uniref:ornithine decarboxylase n=1 Tax=Orchesella cincta TaxID=48709 RepID=A0A1D2MRG0_ORCCI|nr:Ornithine decarboxylase [Orchesella cincta]
MDMPPVETTESNNSSMISTNISMMDLMFDNRRYRVTPETPDIKQLATDLIHNYNLEEPFFVCDIGQIIKKHEAWNLYMPRVRPFYAVKCNDSPLVLETLAGLGTGFDCASKVEMRKVLEIGVSPTDIIYANPAKPRSHIVAAAEQGVQTVTFDSHVELLKMKRYLPGAKLVVRIRCEAERAQCPLGMKFGVNIEDATELLNAAKSLEMDVIGVSFHVGSGCMDPPVFYRAIAEARILFDYAARELGYDFSLLDIGGGFPGNTGTSIVEIAGVVNNALEDFFPQGCGVEVIAEPGRYYVAAAFTLVTQIHSIREIKSDDITRYMYYINDGIYGSFNCIMYDHAIVRPEVIGIRQSDEVNLFECSIWGPTCDGLDQVCSSELLPKMEVGEWLVFPDMGAYTLVAGGTFNGFPLPKVHTVASAITWNSLKDVMKTLAFVVDDVPVFPNSGVGYNRDAVGWGCVEEAVIGRVVSHFSNETEDGQLINLASSATSDDESSISSSESDEGQSSPTEEGVIEENNF